MNARRAAEVTHRAPLPGQTVTPCCGKTPFELPSTDRLTTTDRAVTCAPFIRGYVSDQLRLQLYDQAPEGTVNNLLATLIQHFTERR